MLKRYLTVEETTVTAIAKDLQDGAEFTQTKALAKQRLLRKLELHSQADELVEEIVARYREDLYVICRRVAESDLESGIITRAHVRQAQVVMTRRHRRYSWGDALLTSGGLMVGTAIPHVLAIVADPKTAASPLLISLGFIGALMFGMGVVDKAKG